MLNTNPLSGLPASTPVDGWTYIQTTAIRTANNQNKYLAWTGYDVQANLVTGTLFDKFGVLPVFKAGDVVAVTGTIGDSKGALQVWATHMTHVIDEADRSEFKNRCLPTVPSDELQRYITDLRARNSCHPCIPGSYRYHDRGR